MLSHVVRIFRDKGCLLAQSKRLMDHQTLNVVLVGNISPWGEALPAG